MRLQINLHCIKRLSFKLRARQHFVRVPTVLRQEIVPAPRGVLRAEKPGKIQYFATTHIMLLPVTPWCIQLSTGQLICTGNFAIWRRRDVGIVIFGKGISDSAGSQRKKFTGLALIQGSFVEPPGQPFKMRPRRG
jgi:hypothetical protein